MFVPRLGPVIIFFFIRNTINLFYKLKRSRRTLVRVYSWLGKSPGCVVEVHGPGSDFCYWLNTLDYLMLVVVVAVSILRFGSQ